MDIPIYVINFNDEIRKNKMINRFKSVNLELKITPPVYQNDFRLNFENPKLPKRTCSIMLQHMDSINDFITNTTANYCIICEDDILISKNLNNDLPNIISQFNHLKLDILLLGYLMPYKLESNNYFKLKENSYSYHSYPDDLWGSQMYLISRSYGIFLLNKYTIDYAQTHEDEPYSPDWVITKNGNRAILYPMVALEEGDSKSDHQGQNDFHRRCFECNYKDGVFI